MSNDDTTRIIARKSAPIDELQETVSLSRNSISASNQDDDSHTKIFRPSQSAHSSNEVLVQEPVVGWLVVTKGPGRGRSLSLSYGVNSIGRSSSERVCLDFGDEEISRQRHALVTYDPKGKKFYLQNGEGVNLTYISETPVLQTTELKGGEIISLGKTELHFVAFCGLNFDW
jgi:hypothetical protein